MKISLITIIDNQNIGTYLQAFSLARILEKKGHQVEVVDYCRGASRFFERLKNIFEQKKSLAYKVLLAVYRALTLPISKRILRRFLKHNIKITPRRYRSFDAIKNDPPKADLYITGSDQVWNSEYNAGVDKFFYLGFVPEGKRKIAYAASIGMDHIPDQEKKEIKQLLGGFSHLSVREAASVRMLAEIGLSNVEHVLDPTLLITKKEWEEIAKKDSFVKKEPYLLVYSVEGSKKEMLSKCADELSQRFHLKIYVVTSGWCGARIKCDRIFYFASPERFLNLMLHANFIVACSFHGAAFSINFNKQFISLCPDKYSVRIKDLLETFEINNHLIADFNLKESPLIDYDRVNKILAEKRIKSHAFLDVNVGSGRRIF